MNKEESTRVYVGGRSKRIQGKPHVCKPLVTYIIL